MAVFIINYPRILTTLFRQPARKKQHKRRATIGTPARESLTIIVENGLSHKARRCAAATPLLAAMRAAI
jgi:hypothetical protein